MKIIKAIAMVLGSVVFVAGVFFSLLVGATAYTEEISPKEAIGEILGVSKEGSAETQTKGFSSLGVQSRELDTHACLYRELDRVCVGCHQAKVVRQTEDCVIHSENEVDLSCVTACPQPSLAPAPAPAPPPTPKPPTESKSSVVIPEKERLVPVSTLLLGVVYVKESYAETVRDLNKSAQDYFDRWEKCKEGCWDVFLSVVPSTSEQSAAQKERIRECYKGCEFYAIRAGEALDEINKLVRLSKQ